MRQRAPQHPGHMADDRTALIRLLTLLEQSPRPEGWYARFRRAWDIRQARSMLKWDDARQDGPASLAPMRNELALGMMLLWVGSVGSAFFLSHDALTLARILRALGLSAVALVLSVWYARRATKYVWTRSERQYALYLERARALPAPAGDPDPPATA